MRNIGDKVNLWQYEIDVRNRLTRVTKSVIVTITETKTGAPGEFSRQPVSSQSLRGTGDDGLMYEKHWDSWPESQTSDFQEQWTARFEGGDFWIPKESTSVYHDFAKYGKKKLKVVDRLVGPDGNDIVPQGDVLHCKKHDEYYDKNDQCFPCFADEHRKKQEGSKK